jgi:hypothetical protein
MPDKADREESDIAEAKSGRLKEKIAGLRRQMQALKAMEQRTVGNFVRRLGMIGAKEPDNAATQGTSHI